MNLSKKTLEKLRNLINEETEYRSGPLLVEFFNELGFNDTYGQGFPSRWYYTDEKLTQINGTPALDRCIRNIFAVTNFIGRFGALDGHIADFNQYLAFDKWQVIRNKAEIIFQELEEVDIDELAAGGPKDDEFLSREFADVDVSKLGLENAITDVLQYRITEIERCFSGSAPLAVILLAGSTLEGILLGLADQYARSFNSAKASPKDSSGKVRHFREWGLKAFIDVATELGLIQHDTQKLSHSLRDFRNYIHPLEQLNSSFSPRVHTAKICLQVLRAAITEIGENMGRLRT